MREYFIKPNEDLLDPKLDPIFKALFTSNTKESKGALKDFLTVFIERKVVEVSVMANEKPITHSNEKQIRYDFNCQFNNGELATVEMALKQRPDELVRSEYYLAESFTSQENKGEDNYDDLKNAYQITLLAEGKKFKDEAFVHNFKYYDEKNRVSLEGKTAIITLEMSKIKEKNLSKPDKAGIWGFFLKYANDKSKINILNDIIKYEEGVKMAVQALSRISLNQEMRLKAIRAQKMVKDYLSDCARAKKEGRAEERAKANREIAEERAKANLEIAEERAKAEQEKLEIVKNLLNINLSLEQISQTTGLSIEEIKMLRTD
ncbi:MAG: PD-(D/E)XK nuclease family transposase [Candidatus Improbicoccus devescovinae]|nr:MAG: PD-(D/E)XK nuclease family transposase [Candidatus Improbicoccus devescovinae]